MKICFPVTADEGLESAVYSHFGSAPLFLLVDTDAVTSGRPPDRSANAAAVASSRALRSGSEARTENDSPSVSSSVAIAVRSGTGIATTAPP